MVAGLLHAASTVLLLLLSQLKPARSLLSTCDKVRTYFTSVHVSWKALQSPLLLQASETKKNISREVETQHLV
jgi:hypothetical protein